MKYLGVWVWFCLLGFSLHAQEIEIAALQDSYKGMIGEVVKVPLHFHNSSDKAITLIVRKTGGQIGTSQRNYFCHYGNCMENAAEEIVVRVEAGKTLTDLQVALEAGLVPGVSSLRYIAYNRSDPSEALEFELDFVIEEQPQKSLIYNSRAVALQDVYPNPASDFAFVDYKVLQEQVKAKIVVHSVLGNSMGEYELSVFGNQAKILTGELNSGIYFYTLYVDGEAVMTRKLIVKR